MNTNLFDENYFERGVETQTSLYQNYRWMPEQTIPMVMTIIDYLKIQRGATVLDFGCAKGFVVKAFRLLHLIGIFSRDARYFFINKKARSIVDEIMERRKSGTS